MEQNIKSVLIANKKASVLSELKNMLEKYPYICQAFNSAKQIKKILEIDQTIDLIIIDVFPPSFDGIKLAKYIKQSPRYRYIPIILMSEKWEKYIILECVSIGVTALIATPFNEDDLINKIEAALLESKKNILIVDDDREILKLLKQIFEIERFNVFDVESAEDGWKVIEDNRIDAVITDILLPKTSGGEFLIDIRKKYKNLPVFVITGYGGQFSLETAKKAGANGYFTKPFNNIELIRKLRSVLENPKHSFAHN